MNQAQPQNLDKALEHLTLCLEDPCVPGELEGWTKAVWQALEGVRPVLQNHFAVNHQEHFARITEEDSEMFRQVTLLKKEDRNILQHFESLRTLPKSCWSEPPASSPTKPNCMKRYRPWLPKG